MMYRPEDSSRDLLNRNGPVSLYYQLKEVLRDKIESGIYGKSGRFPTERELEERFRVSRMTVRRALGELVDEGYLVREQGKGSFVAKRKVEDHLRVLTSFTEDMGMRGLKSTAKVLQFSLVTDPEAARKLGIPETEQLFCLQRLRFADGEPLALQTAFVRERCCPELASRPLVEGSLYRTLEEVYGLRLGRALQSVSARCPDTEEAAVLSVGPGQPVLAMERVTYLLSGPPLEFVRSVYRADLYQVVAELTRYGPKLDRRRGSSEDRT